ncbi:hypothetical protein PUN28_002727 [Cardiocondyla obscurior]|uniref:Uncharacterized protein n=1 Tax=Cardiocondyla obscurior TaxID=286306 RepID=A0AAW2GVR1_9HYME
MRKNNCYIRRSCPRRTITMEITMSTRRTTAMVAAACEAFTNISTVARERVYYLMAPTYVFAVNRSLKEQSELLGYLGQLGFSSSFFLSSFLFIFFFFFSLLSFSSSLSPLNNYNHLHTNVQK